MYVFGTHLVAKFEHKQLQFANICSKFKEKISQKKTGTSPYEYLIINYWELGIAYFVLEIGNCMH